MNWKPYDTNEDVAIYEAAEAGDILRFSMKNPTHRTFSALRASFEWYGTGNIRVAIIDLRTCDNNILNEIAVPTLERLASTRREHVTLAVIAEPTQKKVLSGHAELKKVIGECTFDDDESALQAFLIR